MSKLTSFRTTDEIRDKLNEAAKARGVSVNQEINDRIAASFDRQPERIYTDPGLSGLVKLVRVAMQGAGQRAAFLKTGYFGLDPVNVDDIRLWFHDPYAFDQAKRAVEAILEACRPPGSPKPPAYEEADFVAGMRRFGTNVPQAPHRNQAECSGKPRRRSAPRSRPRLAETTRSRLNRSRQMKGSIRERSPGRWAIIIDDPNSGTRKRRWNSFKGSKRQAQVESRG